MSEIGYSLLLRNLSNDYYRRNLGIEDYRAHRKKILDRIEHEFNGRGSQQSSDEEDESTGFMQTVAFMANADIDDNK